jgi:hypothetical protein
MSVRFKRKSSRRNAAISRAVVLPGGCGATEYLCPAVIEPLERRQLLSVFTVTTTADTGAGSLRQAILDSNAATAATNTIDFALTGTGPFIISPATVLPTITQGVLIDGYSQSGASPNTLATSDNAVFQVILDGSTSSVATGLVANGTGITIQGLVLQGFSTAAVTLENSRTAVNGNFVGPLSPTGPANGVGVLVTNSASNVIGGISLGDRNVISGNTTDGIEITGTGSTLNDVAENFIGITPAGNVAQPNLVDGVLVISGANHNNIGLDIAGAGPNTISGNGGAGVDIREAGAVQNTVVNNFIGTDSTGATAVPNVVGVYMAFGAQSNTIGSTTAAGRNVISGNTGDGVEFLDNTGGTNTHSNIVEGNYIGVNAAGAALGNGQNGVDIGNSQDNTISDSGDPNTAGLADGINIIANNTGSGILVDGDTSTGNSYEFNSIYGNKDLDVDLGGDGITANHGTTVATGPNLLQNYPVISSVSADGLTVTGTLTAVPSSTYGIDLYQSDSVATGFPNAGELQKFLATQTVTTDSTGVVNFTFTLTTAIPTGKFVSTTAIDSANNESEVSAPVVVPIPSTGTLSITPTANKSAILNALLAGNTGVTVTSATISSQASKTAKSIGTYSNPQGVFGIGSGIIISTGDVSQYTVPAPASPNTDTRYGVHATTAQEALLDPISGGQTKHFDTTEIQLTFNMPSNLGSVFFNVVFGSREYPDFVGSSFVDAFGLYLNGTNIAQVDNKPVNIDHPDFAASTINALPGLLEPGGNPLLQFSSFVGPGTKNNKLTFIIADTSDDELDTTAYISALGALPPNPNIPTVVVSAPAITTPTPTETFTVTYTGTSAISLASITNDNLVVTGPNVYSQAATLVSVNSATDTSPVTATYSVPGPNGGNFDGFGAGLYTINMQFQQVHDINGNFVTEGSIGTFSNNISSGPEATISAESTFLPGTQNYFFDVTYDGSAPVQISSIGNNDILVTGANGFSQMAKKAGLNTDKNTTSVTATYEITAPGGSWIPADAGSFNFALQANSVFDTKHRAAPATTFGAVALAPFGGLTSTPVGEYGNVGSSAAARLKNSTQNFSAVAYYDPVAQDLKYVTFSKKGLLSQPQLVDSSGNVGLDPAILFKGNQPYIAYYDATNGNLKLAYLVSGKWKTAVIDSVGSTSPKPSIALNGQGNVTISYFNSTSGNLKLAVWNGTAATLSTVDTTPGAGAYSAMVLNTSTGGLSIFYSDPTTTSIKFAAQQSDGTFTTAVVPGTTGASGQFSLAIDTGDLPVISFEHDGTSSTDPSLLELARFNGTTWNTTTVISDPVNVFTESSVQIDQNTNFVDVTYRAVPMGSSGVAASLGIAFGNATGFTNFTPFNQAGDEFITGINGKGDVVVLSEIFGSDGVILLKTPPPT